MNLRTRRMSCWMGCVMVALSGCSDGISIGHDDSKLKPDSNGGAATANVEPDAAPGNGGSGGSATVSSGGATVSNGGATNGSAGATGSVVCASEDGQWTPLLQLSGALPAIPRLRCVRKVATEDMAISGLRVQNSYAMQVGLYAGPPTGPDGPCDGTERPLDGGSTLSRRTISYVNLGVGQVDLAPDVTVQVAKGEEFMLLVQATHATQKGEQGSASVDVKLTSPTAIATTNIGDEAPSALDWFVPDPSAHSAPCDAPWKTLIVANTSIEPGQELVWCVRRTLTEDQDIGAVRATSLPFTQPIPAGLAARDLVVTVVSVSSAQEDWRRAPDGAGPCSADWYDPTVVGITSGTSEIRYADGKASRLKKGDQVMLRAHITNSSASVQTGPFAVVEYQDSSP